MDEAIMAANDKLDSVMQDEQTRRHYWRRQMAIMDQRGQLAYARDEGLAQGIAQGIGQGLAEGRAEGQTEKTLEIARNLKKMGLSVAQIAEGTGLLPDIIEKL